MLCAVSHSAEHFLPTAAGFGHRPGGTFYEEGSMSIEASDIVGDILDRLQDAQRAQFHAEAEDLRAALRRAETRLTVALNLLTEEGRASYENAVNPQASAAAIPF